MPDPSVSQDVEKVISHLRALNEHGYHNHLANIVERLRDRVVQQDKALDALEFAEGAILDAISLEDGLDGPAGERVISLIRETLKANGRQVHPIPVEDQPTDWYRPMADLVTAIARAEAAESRLVHLEQDTTALQEALRATREHDEHSWNCW